MKTPSSTTTTAGTRDSPPTLSTTEMSSPSDKPPASSSKASFMLPFLSLLSINLIAAVDSSALSVSLPIIASDLHSSTLEAYWAGTSFVLASAVLVVLFPAFSNAFGRKPVLLAALVLFTAGTVVAGASGNVTVLIVGRALQGGGSGGLAAMTYVVIADLLPLHQRPSAMAVISLVWLLGSAVGPILGGGFSQAVTWRWIFWICLPFAGLSFILVALFLKTPHRSLHPKAAMKSLDWPGTILFVAALTSLLIALSWGGTMFPWSTYHTIVPLVLGGAGLLLWLVYEKLVPKTPLLPLAVLGNSTLLASFLGTFFMGIAQFGLLYYLPLYYQVILGYTPLAAGAALLVQCAAVGPVAAFAGVYMSKTGQYRLLARLGWLSTILGYGLLQLLGPETTIPTWFFINLPSGIGLGFLFASLPIAAQAAAPPEHMAIAAGLTPFFRNVGQALGIVLGNSVFQNVLRNELQRSTEHPFLRENALEIVENSATVGFLRGWFADREYGSEAMQDYIVALRMIWWTLFACTCAGGVLSLGMKKISLRKPAGTAAPAAAAAVDAPEKSEDLESGSERAESTAVAARIEN